MVAFPKPKTVKLSQYEKAKIYQSKRANKLVNEILGSKQLSKDLKYALRMPKVKRKAKKRVKLPSIRKLTLKADKLFSVFIRQRDKECVLCHSKLNLTCGHLIKRGKRSVRWDEINCHCLCMGCNWKDNFDHDVYVAYFIREYGELMYLDLVDRSRGIFKPTREYLQSIIEKYDIKKT